MNQLRIPIENWDLGKDHIRLECPENLKSKKIESIFYFERKMLPCSMAAAKRDKNGRTFAWGTDQRKYFTFGNMYLDLQGYAWRVIDLLLDLKGKYQPITIPEGYKFDPVQRMIINSMTQTAIFPKPGTTPQHTLVLLPDNPRYKPPKEYDKLGCPKSKDRGYTKLTDQVKKEKAEKIPLADFNKKFFPEESEKDAESILKKSFWRTLFDFIIRLFKRE